MFPLHRVRISLRSRPRMRPQAMQAYTVPRLMFPPMNRWERKTEKSCTRFSQIPNSVPVHMEPAPKGSLVKWTGTPQHVQVDRDAAGILSVLMASRTISAIDHGQCGPLMVASRSLLSTTTGPSNEVKRKDGSPEPKVNTNLPSRL